MPIPIQFQPTSDFWTTVSSRLPANEGHAQNIFPHGPFVGTVGEVAFEYWFRDAFPGRIIGHAGETWHDYVIETRTAAANHKKSPKPPKPRDKMTVEVKTKLRRSFPLSGTKVAKWEVSVPDYLFEHLDPIQKPAVIFAASVMSLN